MKREDFVLRLLQGLPPGLAKQAVEVVGLLPNHHAQSAAAKDIMVTHEIGDKEAVIELLLRLTTRELVRQKSHHALMERRLYGGTR